MFDTYTHSSFLHDCMIFWTNPIINPILYTDKHFYQNIEKLNLCFLHLYLYKYIVTFIGIIFKLFALNMTSCVHKVLPTELYILVCIAADKCHFSGYLLEAIKTNPEPDEQKSVTLYK